MATFAFFVAPLSLLWLTALARKLRRLTHQRGLHFQRLVRAVSERRASLPRLDGPPPPFDPDRVAELYAYESEMAHRFDDESDERRAVDREIGEARWLFNEATMAINVRVETLPVGWFARMMGYRPLPYFD